MRIGKFAASFDVSIDTVRHYMHLGLLSPDKSGGQYSFGSHHMEVMGQVMKLKSLGFTLSEITDYINFLTISHIDLRTRQHDIDLFTSRVRQIDRNIDELKVSRNALEYEIGQLRESMQTEHRAIGVPIGDLSLLACPKCQGAMRLNAEEIIDNQVITGALSCMCHHKMPIVNGILFSDQGPELPIETAVFDLVDYVRETSTAYLAMLRESINWTADIFQHLNQQAVNTLELGTGFGMLLRYIYPSTSDEQLYICTEQDPSRIMYVKEIMKMSESNARLMFICGDYTQLPLRPEKIDCVIDLAGTVTDENQLSGHPYSRMTSFLKKVKTLVGVTLIWQKLNHESDVPEYIQLIYRHDALRNLFEDLAFNIEEERVGKPVVSGGRYENFGAGSSDIRSYCYVLKP